MLITIVGVFIIVFIVVCGVYCLGHWHGKKRCMIENDIIFGKDADEFVRKAKEVEKTSDEIVSIIEKDWEKISDEPSYSDKFFLQEEKNYRYTPPM